MDALTSLILFENQDLLVLNKPSGIHSIAQEGGGRAVSELLLARNPELAAVSEQPAEAGLVHRLDLETSGALLAAKNRDTWERLRRAFSNALLEKRYSALVEGTCVAPQRVRTLLGSTARRGSKVRIKEWRADPPPRFQEAILEIIEARVVDGGARSFVDVRLITGRRHQIRAQLGWIGNPLCGDTVYGGEPLPANLASAGPTFFLHAREITIPKGVLATAHTFAAPMPAYLQAILESRSA